jgi:hypothetical protein
MIKSKTMQKIFIVEDDDGIASSIKAYAEGWGYEVKTVCDFRNVLQEFEQYSPHIVLMDISLPFFSGYYWCQEIRKSSEVPIIFISSASDNMNILMAMSMGADDFIAKPFDLRVLTAKIQALMRRAYNLAPAIKNLEHRGAALNTEDSTLSYGGAKIELSKNEYRILLCLMESTGKIVSREKLMERLWETDQFIDDNTLSVNVNRLRKKLESYGLTDFITTKFGLGYIIN